MSVLAVLLDALAGAFLLLGGFFTLAAGIGLVRLPNVFARMHASTKAGTLGAGLIGLALAFTAEEPGVASRAIGCVAFLLMTGPVGAHLIGRAAARGIDRAEATEAAQGAGQGTDPASQAAPR